MSRRSVRVDPGFFTELDAQLGESRGPNGEPSASDFLLVDLPTLSEAFAERFEELPTLYPDRDDYRYLVATGMLVRTATRTRTARPSQTLPTGVLFVHDHDECVTPRRSQNVR